MTTTSIPTYRLRDIPTGVWMLGFVSLLMDVSSEMIHALFPVYLVTVLGASMLTVGMIEGIAEATAAITKIFSGALSDWLGRRKQLAALGYGLAAFTKPIFPLAPTVGWLVVARFIDRVGKGIRGAPRDALVADIAPAHLRGASFGLRQSLDTIGAFLGPLLAIVLMWLTTDNFTAVFWVAVIPAFMAFGLMLFAVREPSRPAELRRVQRANAMAAEHGVKLQTHVVAGHPVRQIVDLAGELEADLLVIGATGHSAIYERMIGSRADRVVQLAPCPVLVVK